jgi:integrase
MARTIREARLGSPTARTRLKPGRQAHWVTLVSGRAHLGWQRREDRRAGRWLLRRRLDGRYVVEEVGVADDAGPADGVGVYDFDMARARATELAQQGKRPPGRLTVAQAAEDYLAYLRARGRDSRGPAYPFAAHILPQLGKLDVADLTAARLRKWLADLAAAPARRRTGRGKTQKHKTLGDDETVRQRRSSANRVFAGVLRPALNHAFAEGNVTSDAAWRRVKPFGDVDAARLRYLSMDEAARLANACDPDFRRLIQAALLTGARYGELCRLEVRDFDPDANAVHIRKSKSGKPRFVSLNDEAAALLTRVCAGRAGSERMFATSSGRPWGKSHQRRPIEEACARARIERITFHGLRQTYISHAVMRGVPLAVVAEVVGHRDLRMISKHYGHLSRSHVRDMVQQHAPRFGFEADDKVKPMTKARKSG